MKHSRNIILDLDQTIIYSEPMDSKDDESDKKLKILTDNFICHDMEGLYLVCERPGLQQFLDFLFENFNVSVWTAATKSYALFIIKNVILSKPGRHLDYIFFSYHCEISDKKYNYSKKLDMLWDDYKLPGYDKNNTVILDDYVDDVHNSQPHNCLISPEFVAESPNDDFLAKLMILLKKSQNHNKIHTPKINSILVKKDM